MLSPEKLLLSLLEQQEKTLVEFKAFSPLEDSPPDAKDVVSKAAVALANTAMLQEKPSGYLVLGIDDDVKAVGIRISPRDEKEFREILKSRSDPPVIIHEIHKANTQGLSNCHQPESRKKKSDTVYILEVDAAQYAPIRYYPGGRKEEGHLGGIPIRDGPRIRETSVWELQRLVLTGINRQGKESGQSGRMTFDDERNLARRMLKLIGDH